MLTRVPWNENGVREKAKAKGKKLASALKTAIAKRRSTATVKHKAGRGK